MTPKTLPRTVRLRICTLLTAAGPEGMGMAALFAKMPPKTPKDLFYRAAYQLADEGVLERVRWGVLRATCEAPLPSPPAKTPACSGTSVNGHLRNRILMFLKDAGPEGVHRSAIREHIGLGTDASLVAKAIRARVGDGKAREPQWKWVAYCGVPAVLTARVLPFTPENVREHALNHGVVPDTNPGNTPDIPVAWWLLEDAAGTKRTALVGAEDDLISVWTTAYGWVEVDDVVDAIPLPRYLNR